MVRNVDVWGLNKWINISLFALTISFLFAAAVSADGIYVSEDLKHVEGNHSVIILNPDQVKDVESLRKVVLTEEQLAPLRKIYGKTPAELKILSSRWDLCTCDVPVYAVWCRVGEIDVPHSSLESQKCLEEYCKKNPPPVPDADGDPSLTDETDTGRDKDEWNYIFSGRSIIIDSRGNMFHEGSMVSEGELRSMIDEIAAFEAQGKRIIKYLNFDMPPPISSETDRKIVDLAKRAKSYCDEKGVPFGAIGFRFGSDAI